MRKLFVLAGLISVLAFSSNASAFGGCEEDCQKCHSLDKQEARQILEKMNMPDAKLVNIRMSPIGGLWEVTIEDKGKPGIMYVGFSKKHIIGGAIYEVDTASNKTREILSELNKPAERYVETEGIPLDNALLLGKKSAPHKIIVFTDPDCPFCGKLHAEMKKIVSERKDIAFYMMLMPLKFHPDAYWKSQSILCSKSLELLEGNFDKKPVPRPASDCETKAVDENMELGSELGITGTPTLIMPDGFVVIGLKDAGALTKLIMEHKEKND
jgi:thiol:disulfide interchange protein DsbC